MYTEEGKLNDGERTVQTASGKRTVLLLGDSIRQCYCEYVQELLAGACDGDDQRAFQMKEV